MPAPYDDRMPPSLRFPRLTRDEVDDLVAGHPSAIDAGDVLIDPIYRVDRSMKIDTSRLCARPGRFIAIGEPDAASEAVQGPEADGPADPV